MGDDFNVMDSIMPCSSSMNTKLCVDATEPGTWGIHMLAQHVLDFLHVDVKSQGGNKGSVGFFMKVMIAGLWVEKAAWENATKTRAA